MDDEVRQKLLNYAYFYLNVRPRTVKEMRDYLAKKAKKLNSTPGVEESVIERLLELNLLDDGEFLRWYVEGKYASSQKSTFLLRQEMTKKGVPKELMDEYFAGRDVDEVPAARDALKLKWRRYSQYEAKERFKKAASFLSRRGFSYDIIKKTIAEYEEEGYNNGN